MKISFFNKSKTNIPINHESYCIHPCLVIADSVMYFSYSSYLFRMYVDSDSFNDAKLLTESKQISKNDPELIEEIEFVEEMMIHAKKIKQLTRKNKDQLLYLHNYKNGITYIKEYYKDFFETILKGRCCFHLLHFMEKKVLEMKIAEINQHQPFSEEFIKVIPETIIGQESIMMLDQNIETYFSFSTADSPSKRKTDFIKLHLWDFPFFIDLNFEQLNYIREELKPAFAPFKAELDELAILIFDQKLQGVDMEEIRQLFDVKISPYKAPIQHSLDENIFLSKLKNRMNHNNKLRFCLGITSIEILVDYYVKAQVVNPFIAKQNKEQIGQHFDLMSSVLFCYYEIYAPKEIENYLILSSGN